MRKKIISEVKRLNKAIRTQPATAAVTVATALKAFWQQWHRELHKSPANLHAWHAAAGELAFAVNLPEIALVNFNLAEEWAPPSAPRAELRERLGDLYFHFNFLAAATRWYVRSFNSGPGTPWQNKNLLASLRRAQKIARTEAAAQNYHIFASRRGRSSPEKHVIMSALTYLQDWDARAAQRAQQEFLQSALALLDHVSAGLKQIGQAGAAQKIVGLREELISGGKKRAAPSRKKLSRAQLQSSGPGTMREKSMGPRPRPEYHLTNEAGHTTLRLSRRPKNL